MISFENVINEIYACAEGKAAWTELQSMLHKAFDCSSSVFSSFSRSNNYLSLTDFLGVDDSANINNYDPELAARNPLPPQLIQYYLGRQDRTASTVSDWLDGPHFKDTEVYHEHFRRIDVSDLLIVPFDFSSVLEPIGIEFSCGHKRGAFTAEEVRFFKAISPHMVRAKIFFNRFSYARLFERTGLSNTVPAAMLIIDRKGRVLDQNAAADRLFDAHEIILNADGCLDTAFTERRLSLSDAIDRTLDGGLQPGAENGEALYAMPGYEATLSRLSGGDIDNVRYGRDEFLVTIAVANAKKEVLEMAARDFSLTPAEQEVLGLIFAGLSAEKIAERRGTKPSTVRYQIREILLKSGAHSQTELTATIFSLFINGSAKPAMWRLSAAARPSKPASAQR